MVKAIFLTGAAAALILTGIGWSRLTVASYTGDIADKDDYHTCPTLAVRFEQHPIPPAVRMCDCAEPPLRSGRATAVHPPVALVQAAAPGDRIGLQLHEYAPVFGGEIRRAVKWILVGNSVGKETYVAAPAGPIYRSIVLTGVTPLLLGVFLAIAARLLFRLRNTFGD